MGPTVCSKISQFLLVKIISVIRLYSLTFRMEKYAKILPEVYRNLVSNLTTDWISVNKYRWEAFLTMR